MVTEFKIQIPEGMEIDRENSTFECIKFKPKKLSITKYIAMSGLLNNTLHTSGEIIPKIIDSGKNILKV